MGKKIFSLSLFLFLFFVFVSCVACVACVACAAPREAFAVAKTPAASISLAGGLGNRLFQLAFMYAYCMRHGIRLNIANPAYTSQHSANAYDFLTERMAALPFYAQDCTPSVTITETQEQEWTAVPWPRIDRDTLFSGYFQNMQYFDEFTTEIRALFRAPPLTAPPETDSFFLHVRLGDYTGNSLLFLGRENIEAYVRASLGQLPADAVVHVFSDAGGTSQVRKMIEGCAQEFVMVDERDELVAFYRMAACRRGGVASNSTFSWWAAFLNDNPDKRVFFPPTWTARAPGVSHPSPARFAGPFYQE